MSAATRTDAELAPAAARVARRDLLAFLGLVVVLSAPLEIAIGRTQALQDTDGVVLVGPLMLVPAFSSVLVRLATRQGFGDVSFRLGQPARRAVLRSPLLPLLVGGLGYSTALLLGLVHADPPSAGKWVSVVIAAFVVNLVVCAGEEIGWRGFMVTRLVVSGVPAPLLTSGVIWGLWHVPLVLWGGFVVDGPPPWISAALLMVLTTSLGYLLARSRMDTGSVWPPIAIHVTWNVFFQAVFELAVAGRHEGLWLGEAGVLTCVVIAVVAVRSGLAHRRRTQPAPVASVGVGR